MYSTYLYVVPTVYTLGICADCRDRRQVIDLNTIIYTVASIGCVQVHVLCPYTPIAHAHTRQHVTHTHTHTHEWLSKLPPCIRRAVANALAFTLAVYANRGLIGLSLKPMRRAFHSDFQ